MQKRFRTASAVLLVLVAGMLFWQFLHANGPRYNGKPLRAWLKQLDYRGSPGGNQEQAAEAIRQIGERVVPYLVFVLTNTDSGLRVRVEYYLNRHLRIPVLSASDESRGAIAAFEILGSRAKSAVPALAQALQRTGPYPYRYAWLTHVLGAVGPAGWTVLRAGLSSTNWDISFFSSAVLDEYKVDDPATVECLITAATNNPGFTRQCFAVLSHFKSRRDRVVPFFVGELQSNFVGTRNAAMEGLGNLGEASEQVIHILLSTLQSTNQDEVFTAVRVLGQFGPKSQDAEPTLLNMIQERVSGRAKHFLFHLLGHRSGIEYRRPFASAPPNVEEQIRALATALDQIDPDWKNKVAGQLATFPRLLDWLAVGSGVKPYSDGPTLQQWLILKQGDEPQYKGHSLKWWLESRSGVISASSTLDLLDAQRSAAQEAVRVMGTNAIPWLLSWLQSGNWHDAWLARRGFGFLAGPTNSATTALIELGQSSDPKIRNWSYGCLNAIGLDWDTTWHAIIPALHHDNREVRESAADFLMIHYAEQAQSMGISDLMP